MSVDVNAAMGKVGLPAPLAELAAHDWDAIVVGGGHNGLTAAAYLAKAGRSVLVCERREQLGGAATLERPFADDRFIVSPCAYVVGLLDPLVIAELELERHGYRVTPADPNLWCPFPDGTSYAGFIDGERTAAHLREQGFTDADIRGVAELNGVFDRIRDLLRSGPGGDTWLEPSPPRERIEELLGGDGELIDVVFSESMASMLDRYVSDQRLKDALGCQGTIGTFAGPRDPGTASIRLMHHQGNLLGLGSVWGYVEGGLGRVSFAIAQAAIEAGAQLAAGVPVAAIRPGEGVELESGDFLRAPTVICNADPKRALAMLDAGDAPIPDAYRRRLEGWDVRSPVLKLNVALKRFPTFTAAGAVQPQRAMVTITDGIDAAQEAVESARRGEPAIGFLELYFQSAYDDSVAPPDHEVMSVFCQYVPYELAEGDWDSRRGEIAELALDRIAVHAPDVRECVSEMQVMGPPDIEERIGLSGGHIFQGQALPEQMWDRRLAARTPVDGLYLCGAATHPGGSVIALNGRIAAMQALASVEAGAVA
jgi:phytoene dehydrogenase-like protein